MKKFGIVLTVLLFCVFAAYSAQYNTIPLDHKVYRIIDYAEINKIIPIQSNVKPYDYDTVRNLLEIISKAEMKDFSREHLQIVIAELDRVYGKKPVSGKDFWTNGFFRASNPANGNTFQGGVKGKMNEHVGLNNSKDKIIDLRNVGTMYFTGDLFERMSFNMNASLKLDKFSPMAYMTEEDYIFDAQGDYFISFKSENEHWSARNVKANEPGFFVGFSASPEVNFSFLKNRLKFRFGSFKRNWGPGTENLVLSASACEFNGVQIDVDPMPVFHFSSLTGSLNNTILESIYSDKHVRSGAEQLGQGDNKKSVTYNNMLSIQRLEFATKHGFQFGLFESCVWQKRFELSYFNPFSIYWFTQAMVGDIDNVLGGADFSWNIKNFGTIYGAIAIDEFTKDLGHLFSNARNVAAFQGGFKFPGNLFGAFTMFTLQATYIPPFYGAHYYQVDSNNTYRSINYTNKGFNLFYPTTPDSIEFLIGCDMSLKQGWGLSITARDQVKSAQFATDSTSLDVAAKDLTGTTVLNTINYDDSDSYANKDLFGNIWQNVFDLNVKFTKEFAGFPVKLSVGLDGIFDWRRPYANEVKECSIIYNNGKYNTGYNTTFGDWQTPEVRVVGNVVFSMYY